MNFCNRELARRLEGAETAAGIGAGGAWQEPSFQPLAVRLSFFSPRDHDVRYAISKLCPQLSRIGTAIFHAIVEENGDDFLLISAVIEHKARHGKHVGCKWNFGTLAQLAGMHSQCKVKSFFKLVCEIHPCPLSGSAYLMATNVASPTLL